MDPHVTAGSKFVVVYIETAGGMKQLQYPCYSIGIRLLTLLFLMVPSSPVGYTVVCVV